MINGKWFKDWVVERQEEEEEDVFILKDILIVIQLLMLQNTKMDLEYTLWSFMTTPLRASELKLSRMAILKYILGL